MIFNLIVIEILEIVRKLLGLAGCVKCSESEYSVICI